MERQVGGTPETAMLPEMLTRLMPRLMRRARRLCGSRDAAEDLVQETVLKLLQRRLQGAPIAAPESYAMIVLHNLARQGWRDRHPTEEVAEDMASTAPCGPGKLACAELSAAIDRLPEAQARLMRLVAGGETSPARLAAITGVPVGTVMSRLARARVQLRVDMDLECGAPVAELL